jgi:hypothetical protein
LSPNTQKRIAEAVYRAWADLAPVLGREGLTHTEGIQLLCQADLPISFILQTNVGKAIFPEGLVTAETSQNLLPSIDTEEKFEAFLLQQPEPSREKLRKILTMINGLLPRVRQLLAENVKQLPHDRGGRPEKISSTQEQQKIIEEIKKLREPGKLLKDIFVVVARRHGVSPSKIKQVWYSRSESNSKKQKRHHKATRTAKAPLPLKKR